MDNIKGDCVFIFSPGRSGSSFCKALFEDRTQVFNVHCLDNNFNIDGMDMSKVLKPNELNEYIKYQKLYKKKLLENNSKILTLIRDPVARCVSSYYHHIAFNEDISVEQAIANFINTFPHDWTLNWMNEQFKKHLGVDLYKEEFNKELGFKKNDAGNSIIIMRTDKISLLKSVVKDNWNLALRKKPKKIRNKNKAGNTYKRVIKKFKLPKNYLDKMYNSEFAKFFFTDKEIIDLRNKWIIKK